MSKIGMVIALVRVVVWGGWAVNIYKLTQLDFESPYKAEAIRAVGLIPPVGAVIAWFDIEDK